MRETADARSTWPRRSTRSSARSRRSSRKCAGASSSRTSSRSWRRSTPCVRRVRAVQPARCRLQAGGCSHSTPRAAAGVRRARRAAPPAPARAVASSCHGALSISMPLPFMRSGESSGRTSSSATSADLAGKAAARAIERLQRAPQLDRIPERVSGLRPARQALRAARRWRRRTPPAALRRADRSAPGRGRTWSRRSSAAAAPSSRRSRRVRARPRADRGRSWPAAARLPPGAARRRRCGRARAGHAPAARASRGRRARRARCRQARTALQVAADQRVARRLRPAAGRCRPRLRRCAARNCCRARTGRGRRGCPARSTGAGLAVRASHSASRTTCLSTSAWLPAWKAWR